jgi:hypothetical protein
MSVKTIRNAEGKRVRVRDFGAHDVARYVPAKVKDRMPHQGAREKARRLKCSA